MNDFNDLAEKNAKLIPVKIWRFCAYKSEADNELNLDNNEYSKNTQKTI